MMRKLLFFLLFINVFSLTAQDHCASDKENLREQHSDSEFDEGIQLLNALSAEFEFDQSSASVRDGFKEVTIPVVVHVLYREEENNISYEQIQSQIDVLNRDFNAENGDLDKIPEVFRALATSAQIRFRLADKDQYGNFTKGVTRTLTTVENIGTENLYHQSTRGGRDPWPQVHYMNVWVCELEGNTLGFAILPGSKMSERDGIVMSPRAFGTLGTAIEPYNLGRTFVHEVGHYLGLRHLWGSDDESCSSTDYISDTPTQLKENFGCKSFPTYSCPGQQNGDMFMNYMDYGNDSCMFLFTQRQVDLMHLVMKTNRSALFHSEGFTGIEAERNLSELKIYPNPSDGIFHVEFGEQTPSKIELVNMLGDVVYSYSPTSKIELINVRELPPGIYSLVTPSQTNQIVIR